MRLNRRLEAITGLSTASPHSEALQVIIKPECIGINHRKGGSMGRVCSAIHERPSAKDTSDAQTFALCAIKLQDLILAFGCKEGTVRAFQCFPEILLEKQLTRF